MTAESAPVQRVLFVCTGNTYRSVFAEYLARQAFGGSVDFESAGIRPQTAADAENSVFTLRHNFKIDASKHVPRDIRALDLSNYSLIIALESHVANVGSAAWCSRVTGETLEDQGPLGIRSQRVGAAWWRARHQ